MLQENLNLLLFSLVLTTLLFVVLWWFPKRQMKSLLNKPSSKKEEELFNREKERLKLEDDSRKTLAQILGGSILLFGLLFTYNKFILDREGQITDRFYNAVSLLGNDKEEVRIGSLYALKRIAMDSEKDSSDVKKIFEEYIRKNLKGEERLCQTETEKKDLPIDVIVAMENLTVMSKKGFDFKNVNFSCFKVPRINLEKSEFFNANFNNSEFSGLNLDEAVIQRTSFKGSRLYDMKLSKAILKNCVLFNTQLANAAIKETGFANTDLTEANFENASFRVSVFRNVTFNKTNFRNADLYFCKFVGKGTFTTTIDPTTGKFAEVFGILDFSDTDLTNTNLGLADLRNVDLSKTKGLVFDKLKEAIIDKNTILPAHLEVAKDELLRQSEMNIKRLQELERLSNVSEVNTIAEIMSKLS